MPGHQAVGEGADQEVVGEALDDVGRDRPGALRAVGTRGEPESRHHPQGRKRDPGRHDQPQRRAPRHGTEAIPLPTDEGGREECEHGPAADERMKSGGRPEPDPSEGRPAADEPADTGEHEGPGEDLRFAATDHPLSRRRSVAGRQREQRRCQDPRSGRRQQSRREKGKPGGQAPPTEPTADPRGLLEREGGGQGTQKPVEHPMGFR